MIKSTKLIGLSKEHQEKAYAFFPKNIHPNSWLGLRLYNLFNAHNHKRTDIQLIKIGEAPHLLDSSYVELTRKQIEKYLFSKGYLRAQVNYQINTVNKKASIKFIAVTGPLFTIRNYSYNILDTSVSKLYAKYKTSWASILPGAPLDQDAIIAEVDQIYYMMKDNGYYDFIKQYVHFDVDTSIGFNHVDVKLHIDNPAEQSKHIAYTINQVYLSIKSNNIEPTTGPVLTDTQYHVNDYTHKFSPKALTKCVAFQKDSLFSIRKEDLTYSRLYDLNVFEAIKIGYKKPKNRPQVLNVSIEANPLKRMSNKITGEYTFNSGKEGFNISNTFTHRNLFGGAEQLNIQLKYGILFDSGLSGGALQNVFNRDLQLKTRLLLPRLVLPFQKRSLWGNTSPRTLFTSSLQLFKQRNALVSRVFSNAITYEWASDKYKFHSLTPFNFEYREGHLDPAFKDSLAKRGYNLYIQTNNRQYLSFGSQYAFTYNAIRLASYENFFFIKTRLNVSGNTLGLLNKIVHFKQNANHELTIFRIPYLQFAKTEVDLRYYYTLGQEQQVIMRINPGIAIPYGNTQALPFEANFYGGGSSSNRAWQARTLGPGNYNRSSIPDPTTRQNLRNLDQLGEVKLESNIEYRFKLINNLMGTKIKGALFTDIGNIWRLRKTADNPGGELLMRKFLPQLAVGTGAGIRLDAGYFIFRFDTGLKIKDPEFTGANQWVIKQLSHIKRFKEAYNKTNAPDSYSFFQWNIGVGMPF